MTATRVYIFEGSTDFAWKLVIAKQRKELVKEEAFECPTFDYGVADEELARGLGCLPFEYARDEDRQVVLGSAFDAQPKTALCSSCHAYHSFLLAILRKSVLF